MFTQSVRYIVLFWCIALLFITVGAYYYFKPMPHKLSYLALGDSYTVGAHLMYDENYPKQVVTYLRAHGLDVGEPVFIAHAGWTSDDLCKGVRRKNLQDTFTFVTLLIGANNQFRGLGHAIYRQQFSELLSKAITFVNGHTERVFVLAMPDWSASPFANGKDRDKISAEVAAYNTIIKEMTQGNKCHFVDISGILRERATDASYFLGDFVHPSAKGYTLWAERLAPAVASVLKP